MPAENPPTHESPLDPETLAVTAGRPEKRPDAPLNPPVVFASTYIGTGLDGTAPTGSGELGYGRYGNPTWQALESALGALEGGRAVTYSTGMAAAHAVFEVVPRGGVMVLPEQCYLGVASAAEERARLDATTIRRVPMTDTEAILAAADGADLVWLESPSNPGIEVADLPAVLAALHSAPSSRGGAPITVVDSTFATPLLQQPIGLGADLVLHSGTKFLSGHSDALLGALVVRPDDPDLFTRLDHVRRLHGATPGTMEAYLVLRGLRTLAVRLDRAQHNAQVIAERLAGHHAVRRIRYPGLPDDASHGVAARTMAGFGALLAVDLADARAADAFVAACRVWVFATSLGGVESTLERRRRWSSELPSIPEGLVRMSVGIENVEDLWADLEQALGAVS